MPRTHNNEPTNSEGSGHAPSSRDSGAAMGASDLIDLVELTMASLRSYRKGLIDESDRVSYWRRLIQVRLDLISATKAAEEITTADLITSLGHTASGARRQQFLSIKAHDELPDLPGLNDLWTAAIDPSDVVATEALVAQLQAAEAKLSAYRNSLHARLDAATDELVARYKANPDLTDDLFLNFG